MAQPDKKSIPNKAGIGFLRKTDREQGYKKTAEFLLLLDKTQAARVLARLSEDEIEGITREIALIKHIDPAEAKRIAAEFGVPTVSPETGNQEAGQGGLESAAGILRAAVGEARAVEILAKVEELLAPGHFSFLHDLHGDELQALLADESPQVIALVLAYLEPAQASGVLERLTESVQAEVAKRIAQMDKLLPEVVRRTADTLKKKLFRQTDFSSRYIDGKSALRDILQHMSLGQERALLDTLSEEKPDLAVELEKALFTLAIFKKLTDRDRQLFLRAVTDRDLAVSLKGETEEIRNLFYSSISERRKALIQEESDLLGPMSKKDVEAVQQVLLDALKTKIGTGEIVLLDENEEIIR